ncbi:MULTISPECIES: penicillin-insensitive murein endopeptidase [unclassified Arsukibacterium]|uniref:penicillin-insensitive murein endopeptidase n=1 Tax=unclassified Arsukibacterium TaxID=2635278 RepID=UPI000C545C1E|nr:MULTISPECIES: penicillin-insensitive murein endopeptidase [unclassified Arsukibacterium]MBM34523.1 replication initiation protein [Rheinheimera sp.]HAW91944.1 replication initiation protein [Candidatus Azambacteria bacterium]|tara:strand:- start:1173 stop:1841 length:669 start_codon:yes stop_codon:yes gene_type:complete
MKYLFLILVVVAFSVTAQESTCYGTTSDGRLANGVKLSYAGPNFVGYSTVARLAGRTYVHSQVDKIIVAAYKDLETSQPGKVFKYAETGYKEGGRFKPHKTHRNGLSVDFMVPVIDETGQSVHLPTSPLNKFGYNIEFSSNGEYKNYTIDYEAMAAHIIALHRAAKRQGHDLWRVIFDSELQPNLLKSKYGEYLAQNIQFSKKRSWVRHDEHYHVDFEIPCN